MSSKDIAIKVENISKLYRIGLKEKIHDNFANVLFDFIKSPLTNYRKYRSLYNFDDINPNADSNLDSLDIIWALRGISFEVKEGELIGIIGRNGAGKSTLLKVLSRIAVPNKGYIEIRGKVSSLLEVGTGFNPELTGRENIYLNGTILGMKKKEIDHKFDEIVEFSGMEKFLDTPVKRYSSGMSVRLAFAVAAHLDPEILIVDEVLAVGDAAFQKKCLKKMHEVSEQGRTILFVSHNMSVISRLCDRGILIDKGRIIKDGPIQQVVSTYLTSEFKKSEEKKWPILSQAPGNDIVRLRAVRVCDQNAQSSFTIDISQPVMIQMKYEVLKPGYALLPHFTLHNDQGLCIFVGIDQDVEWHGRPREVGIYESTALIPANLLAEGTMFVGPVMRTVDPDMFHYYVENAVAFETIDSCLKNSKRAGYSKHIPGVVRPLLRWSTKYEPNGL